MSMMETLKGTNWPITLQIAATRVVTAALILAVISFDSSSSGTPFWEIVPYFFKWIMWLSIFMGVAIPALALARSGEGWASWVLIPAWLVCVADPVLKVLHTKRPDLFPVEEFKYFFNPPLLTILANEEDRCSSSLPGSSWSHSQPQPASSQAREDDFERGKQLFNRGEQKDGLEMVAAFAASNPSHVEANLFMARELGNADLHGFAELIRKYAQNVLRNAPSNEEARRILDRLNNTGQSESAQPPQQSTINLAKGTDNNTTSGAGQIVRVGWDAFQSAYQSGSSDQKAWVDSEEAGLLARKLVEEASLDSQSTKIRAGLIRVISNYYLRIINQNELAAHIEVESDLSREHAEKMASNIVKSVKLA